MGKMNDDARRTAEAYAYIAAACLLLALAAVCITVGLFFGAAWGMAVFTLLCVFVAIGAWRVARAKADEARKAAQE